VSVPAVPTKCILFSSDPLCLACSVHPNGNIADFLVAAGFAKVVDWHAGILSSVGGLDRLRAAEKAAKEKRLGIWEKFVAPTAVKASSSGATNGAHPAVATAKGTSFDAVVTRIWSADSISVVAKDDAQGKERRLQLASVRGPRGTGAKEAYYQQEAKEFLRKRLIGKTVHVFVDYVKPADGDYEEKECVTIKYGGAANNVSQQLVEKGLATVLRHKRDDEDRSAELDALIAAEQS
jgi:staphylococcal nuclease domain-containing protein 1